MMLCQATPSSRWLSDHDRTKVIAISSKRIPTAIQAIEHRATRWTGHNSVFTILKHNLERRPRNKASSLAIYSRQNEQNSSLIPLHSRIWDEARCSMLFNAIAAQALFSSLLSRFSIESVDIFLCAARPSTRSNGSNRCNPISVLLLLKGPLNEQRVNNV
jgi:hypothetical protein